METRRKRPVSETETAYTPTPVYKLTRNNINAYILTHHQCQQLNDKYYIVGINPYTNQQLHLTLPIITNLHGLDDGFYIYVLLSLDNGEPSMYFIKTYTSYEIGTKHQQLIYRIACNNQTCKKYNLYYAGELQKRGNEIKFNFYSGTFKMATKLKKTKLPQDIEYMKQHILSLCDEGIYIQFMDEPIITSENILFTQKDLDDLKHLGANVNTTPEKKE